MMIDRPDKEWIFGRGQYVKKRTGSSWHGKVVGFYTTGWTPRGYCVESEFEPGSVQIYPEISLIPWVKE